MMSPNTYALSDQSAASPASRTETFLLLALLPVELRHAVFRHCLVNESGMIEVVSNYLDCQPPERIKFFTVRNLSLLEANKQLRNEASELFYAENIFTLKSYPRTQEYRQKRFYGSKTYLVDYSRVRRAHILSSPGFIPTSLDGCIQGACRMMAYLKGIADALAGGHCMRYLLVQSYDFEIVSLRADTPWGLANILEPLEKVRGLQICHIRAMNLSLWPYLRFLEREMTRSCSDTSNIAERRRPLLEKALTCQGIMTAMGVTNGHGDPDLPLTNMIFEIFDTEPLYKSTDFIDTFEWDILSEG